MAAAVVTLAPGAVNLAASLVTYARTDARRIQERRVQNFTRKTQRYVGCNRRVILKRIPEERGRNVCVWIRTDGRRALAHTIVELLEDLVSG